MKSALMKDIENLLIDTSYLTQMKHNKNIYKIFSDLPNTF